MANNVIYTSALSPELMDWLQKTVKDYNCTKKDVIENALTLYKIQLKKEKLKKMFKRASKDKGIVNMAEEGLYDYSHQLKKLDK